MRSEADRLAETARLSDIAGLAARILIVVDPARGMALRAVASHTRSQLT